MFTQIRKAREIIRVEEPESGYKIIAKNAEGKRFKRKFQQSTCFLRNFVIWTKVIISKDSTIRGGQGFCGVDVFLMR